MIGTLGARATFRRATLACAFAASLSGCYTAVRHRIEPSGEVTVQLSSADGFTFHQPLMPPGSSTWSCRLQKADVTVREVLGDTIHVEEVVIHRRARGPRCVQGLAGYIVASENPTLRSVTPGMSADVTRFRTGIVVAMLIGLLVTVQIQK